MFIQELNDFLFLIFNKQTWDIIQIIFAFLVFFGSIQQRVHMDIFKSGSDFIPYSIIKIGQIGLYGQMMLGIITMVDGYTGLLYGYSHPLVALWVISSSFVKFNIYYNIFHLKSYKPQKEEIA